MRSHFTYLPLNMIPWTFSAMALLISACGPSGETVEGDTQAEGQTQYKDAQTDDSGATQEPAKPRAQDMDVEIHMAGTGTLSGLQPECQLEGSGGQFTGLLQGTGQIDANGLYVAGFVTAEGLFTVPSGSCEIPELSIGTLTEVSVRALLENTTENCQTYCESKARSQAEAECQSQVDEASCRASVEASYSSSCQTSCSGSTTRRIVAEASLSAQALATLNAQALGLEGFGTLEADLTFDRIEEANGEEVPEE